MPNIIFKKGGNCCRRNNNSRKVSQPDEAHQLSSTAVSKSFLNIIPLSFSFTKHCINVRSIIGNYDPLQVRATGENHEINFVYKIANVPLRKTKLKVSIILCACMYVCVHVCVHVCMCVCVLH